MGIKVILDTPNPKLQAALESMLEKDSSQNRTVDVEGVLYQTRLGGNVVNVLSDKIIGDWAVTPITLDTIVERCSHFSGFKLQWKLEERPYGRVLTFLGPKGYAEYYLALTEQFGVLHEAAGRLRHWNITRDEQVVMLAALIPEEEKDSARAGYALGCGSLEVK